MFSSTFSWKALAAILPILSAANAHMIMSSPVPYGKSTLTNSPLIADGSDFPCKQRSGVYALEGASNTMAAGSTQTLSFIGSAVHGGGSCQVSLTTDKAPTASTKWMVIHSIQGNCPSNVTGNLDANAAGTGAAVFDYTIPSSMPAGDYTIAWSWVNKIGNREFYMNCGPATITAAAKKRYAPAPNVEKRQSSYPALFVANLAGVSSGCATTEGVDTQYPNPGSSVQNGNIGVNPGPPTGCTGGDTSTSSGGNSTSSGGSSSGSSASAASPAATSAAAGSASSASAAAPSASGGGVFASGAGGASSAGSPAATSTAVVSPIPAATSAGAGGAAPSAATASAAVPSSTGAPSTSGAMAGSCADGNAYYCLADGLSFQRCGSGTWTSPPTEMPAGTTCSPGTSDSFQMKVVATKVRRGAHHQRVRRSEKVWAA